MEYVLNMLAVLVTSFMMSHLGLAQVKILESPNSIILEEEDETTLSCQMDTAPDRFQWRHYPVDLKEAYSSGNHLVLAEAHYVNVQQNMYKNVNSTTYLTIANTNVSVAGFYQCLAHYGAQVIASKLGRISLPTLSEIPAQKNVTVTVTEGNTVQWSCPEPTSNPAPIMNYYSYGKKKMMPRFLQYSLILPNVTVNDKNTYSCTAFNQYKLVYGHSYLNLNVIKGRGAHSEKPKFIVQPKQHYVVLKDSNVLLECAAVGEPIPIVRWSKVNGELPNKKRARKETGGLYISNVRHSDEGVYICEYTNNLGSVSVNIEVEYNEPPKVIRGPFNRENATATIQEGQALELECEVSGVPTPVVSWFLNGRTIKNDSNTEVTGNILRFGTMLKTHAGMVQCFVSNIVSTDCGYLSMLVFPKQISGDEEYSTIASNHRKRKHKTVRGRKQQANPHMIPPSKPNITRLNDESVVVRWNVPPSQEVGLKIKFFKVQYRDISRENDVSSTWLTANRDIEPHITSFEVTNLKSDHTYRFRIAAIYSNDDNKPSPKSDPFHLKRLDFETRNPLPIPTITATETINSTSIKVYWEYTPVPNITINGFYVNYMPATISGDYTKATVDGEHTRSYVISHLDPNTIYEIKMQTFNSKHASDLSAKMHQRTTPLIAETTIMPQAKKSEQEQTASVNLYVIIAGVVIGVALLLIVVIVLIVGRNWKKKKNANRNGNNDKQPTEDMNHHIQVENKEYAMPHKNSRSNGCVISANHITIRSNPLADTDNKNQNMIEMSCLSSQNNNCSTQPSASNQEIHHHADKKVVTATAIAKNKKNKNNDNPGENYV